MLLMTSSISGGVEEQPKQQEQHRAYADNHHNHNHNNNNNNSSHDNSNLCGPVDNQNKSMWNVTDDVGNRLELVCVEKFSSLTNSSSGVTRFELLFHSASSSSLSSSSLSSPPPLTKDPAVEEEEDLPVVAAICPYVNGHNLWRWVYTNDSNTGEESFKMIHWASYDIPDGFQDMEPGSTLTINVTSFIFDVETGLRQKTISEGNITIIVAEEEKEEGNPTSIEFVNRFESVPGTFEVIQRETVRPLPVNYTALLLNHH